MRLPTAAHGISSAVINDTIYFAGGAGANLFDQFSMDYFDIYNITSETWSRGQLSIPRAYLTTTAVGHRVVFAGGALKPSNNATVVSTRIDIYDTLTSTWYTQELNEPRFMHVAATYGDKVFFAGGATEAISDLIPSLATIEMLDLTTNNISIVYTMDTSRFTMTAGTTMDVVYFAGGRRHTDLEPLDEIYFYNVTADEWSIERLPEGRSYPSSAVYGTKIYFAGGWGRNFVASNRIDIYDTVTRSWDIKSLEEPRGLLASAVLDTKIFFAGGVGSVFSSNVDVLDAITGEQLSLRLQQGRQMMTAPTDGTRIYFAGGLVNDITNSDLIEIFDSNGIMDALETPRARSMFASTAANQLVFFAGGYLTDGSTTDIVDIYDERAGQWREGRLSRPRAFVLSAVVRNKVFFIGGIDGANASLPHIDIFDTLTQRWTTAQLSQTRMDFSVVKSDNFLFVAGGAQQIEDLTAPLYDVVDIYDDETGQWTTARLSLARSYISSYAYKTKVFFAGGHNGTSPSTDIDIFDTSTKTWSVAHLRSPRSFIGIGGIADRVLFAGGLGPFGFFSRAIDIYATDTGRWSTAELSQPRWETKVVQAGDFLFLGAGRSRTQTTVVDAFDSVSRQLSPDFRLTVPRHGMLATGFGTKLIYAGGLYVNGAAQFRGFSSSVEVFEIIPSAPFTSYFLTKNAQWSHAVVSGNKIYYSAENYSVANVLELPQVTEPLTNQQQFLGGSVSFNTTIDGRKITYEWTHNNMAINSAESGIVIPNISFESSGDYTVTGTDKCRNIASSKGHLQVLTSPLFTRRLNDTVIICGGSVVMNVEALGNRVSYAWFIGGVQQDHLDSASLTFTSSSDSCDVDHRICVDAHNPAGTTTSCAMLRVSSYESIFAGPTVVNPRATWFLTDKAEIRVGIVEPLCKIHEWYENDLKRQREIGEQSSFFVDITASTDTNEYTVRAHCGTTITSLPVRFHVTLLPWWGLFLILIFAVAVIGVVAVIVIKIRRRFQRKQDRELELKELLDDAKRTVLTNNNPNSASVINVRTWEWIPDDNYSYVPLSDLPFAIDTSNVHFLKKNQQLEIGIWMQGDIIFSSKAKNSKSSSLKERLLNKSIQVSIYAPRSPKYEMTVDPQHVTIGQDEVRVLVSLVMKMTTKTKINLIIGLEDWQIYSAIEFNLTSKISPWIDADEVVVQGEPIGVGGFGTVSKAIYRGQEIAFKKLKVQELVPSAVQEFEREIDLMMNLHHPNIIQFVGASRAKGSLAILTEFAPLGSLESSLKSKRLNVHQQVIVLYEAARALQFLHTNNILHRDIKPENLLVFSLEPSAPVHVKLSDFGTSRLVEDQPSTMTRGVGTPMYMAPELFSKGNYERSADIYSFGMLMWSVMHQQEPYDSPEFQFPWDVPNFIKAGQRLAISEAVCPPEVAQLIRECWAQEPANRPPISQVAQQLAAIVSNLSSKPVS